MTASTQTPSVDPRWKLLRDGKTAIGPASDIKRWSANYVTQRSITRDKSLALSRAEERISLLHEAAAEDSTALVECNEEKTRFKDGYNKRGEEITGLEQQNKRKTGTNRALWIAVIAETLFILFAP